MVGGAAVVAANYLHPYLPVGWLPLAGGIAAGLVGALMPDIDQPVSTISHDLGIAREEALTPAAPTADEGWKSAVIKFAFLGNGHGWGWRSMCRFVGRREWRTLLDLMIGAEVLAPGRGNQDSEWINGWSYVKFRPAVKYDRLSLPFPADPAPAVMWVRGYPSRTSTHATHAAHAPGE